MYSGTSKKKSDKQHLGKPNASVKDPLVLTPFLKWPGGKRWFVDKYPNFLPKKFDRYFEPFLGGGAVFFHLKPKTAILSDKNQELIAAYESVKNDAEGLAKILAKHQELHGTEHYYQIRDSKPRTEARKGARLVYLNRTCFNGIYRVNLDGKFNVPKGSKTNVIMGTDNFDGIAELLSGAELRVSDFEPVIDEATKGDFIFADPPYTVRHNVNGFVKYNEVLFSWDDQIRLAEVLARARDRGVKILATNANHHSVRKLYRDRGFKFKKLSRYSSISADSDSRKEFEELIIFSP